MEWGSIGKKLFLAWKLPPTDQKRYTAVEVKNPAIGDLLNTIEKKMRFMLLWGRGLALAGLNLDVSLQGKKKLLVRGKYLLELDFPVNMKHSVLFQ